MVQVASWQLCSLLPCEMLVVLDISRQATRFLA